MLKPLLAFLDPVFRPAERTRLLCLLLLATMVGSLLYVGSQPGIEVVIPNPPWDKLAHAAAYGSIAAVAWVGLGAVSRTGAVAIAFVVGLMDEGMQYYTPGRSADPADLVADLLGAVLAVLILQMLKNMAGRAAIGGAT